VDYFYTVHDKQPHGLLFINILSNFLEAWVYIAAFSKDGPKIQEYPCQSLTDAVLYAKVTSKSQFKMSIPCLDSKFKSKYDVLALGKQCFLLSVIKLPSTVPTHMSAQNQATNAWKSPTQHCDPKGWFVMKILHNGCSLQHEIQILTKI
jgi:hypothetical protein